LGQSAGPPLFTEKRYLGDSPIAGNAGGSYRGVDMSTPVPPQREKTAWTPDPGRRRSMRVLLSVPIHVSGKTTAEQDFIEETRTLVVNAHGALIALAARVAAGQEITITNKATQQSLQCSIVYLGNSQGGKTQMGIEFVKPSSSFWQVDFPPDDWVVPEN